MEVKIFEKEIYKNTAEELRKLILFNSNHTWDDVILQLQKATGYDLVHCEQVATIAHTKGKAVVKSGDAGELGSINSILREINLVTAIE
ncbi:MAG: ATP-dependent Clp protease adaptor ClpS [Bacteroidota bacterium]|nr:ATP-dependent Clp protease adaptor ClpS [Bacteroidota bacterium]